MGKPGNKNQSSVSNIFKRVPNYNYKEQGSEAMNFDHIFHNLVKV